MKNKILYIFGLVLMSTAVVFYSCEEKDDYNYDNIEPVITAISGPGTVNSHGLSEFPFRYTVPARGGSTYDWEVTGHGGDIVQDEDDPSIAYIIFNQANQTEPATISVTETTLGGKTASLSRDITLNQFCLIPEELEGEYHEEDEEGFEYQPIILTKDPNDPAGLLLEGILGSFFGDPSGVGKLTLDYCTGDISLQKHATGIIHPVYGMVYIEQEEETEGTYDFDTGVITVTIKITVDAGSFGAFEYYFTPID